MVVLAVLTPALAGAADAVLGKPALPASPEAWLEQMANAKKNGLAFKDPAAFAEWLDTITEPRFMTALAAVATDPATYPKVMVDAIDPAAVRNWTEFTDPKLYLRWMLASADPSFQQAIVSKMADPAKFQRWVEAIGRPDVGKQMLATFSKAPLAWQQAPFQGANYAPDVKVPMAWFGAMAGGMGQEVGSREWLNLPVATSGTRYRY